MLRMYIGSYAASAADIMDMLTCWLPRHLCRAAHNVSSGLPHFRRMRLNSFPAGTGHAAVKQLRCVLAYISVAYNIYHHAGLLRAPQSKCNTFACQIDMSYILIQGIVNPACLPASTRPCEPGVTLSAMRSMHVRWSTNSAMGVTIHAAWNCQLYRWTMMGWSSALDQGPRFMTISQSVKWL
jgi:hypothetical protein